MKRHKYTRLSICRRTINIYIFLMLWGILTLILSVVSIYQMVDATVTDIENTYGRSFVLKVVKDESNPDFWEEIELAYDQGTATKYNGPNVSFAMLDRLKSEVKGITEYEAGFPYDVMLWDYKLLEGYEYRSYLEMLEHPERKYMFSAEETKNLQYIAQVYPVCNSQNLKEFKNGSFRLVEGRHITMEDAYAVMISKKLAEKNNLKLGDTLRIETDSLFMGTGYPIDTLGGMDATIVGFYELTYEQPISYYTKEREILENGIVADRQISMKLSELYGDSDHIGSGIIYVENPKDLEKVMEDVKALDWIDWKYYTIYENDSEYSEAIKPLKNINTMMIVGGFLIGLLGMVLIYVLTKHGVKKRNREMGILMALGISAKEIRRQIWKEYLLLTTIAFGAAFMLCMAITPTLGNGIYQRMNGNNEIKEYTEKEIEAAIARGDNTLAAEMAKDQHQLQDSIIVDKLEMKMESWVILIIAGAELLVVWFFVDIAIDKTLKQKPIDILSMIR